MASGVENVYGLGSEGVNVVDSPIHLKNGEVTQAQNAAFPTDKGQGGLGMRGGLARINSVAMGGSVAGVVNVPLPNPGSITRSYKLALMTADADTWATSTDGTTFTEGTTPALAAAIDKNPFASTFMGQRACSFNRKLYYPGNDYTLYPAVGATAPYVRVWDGVTDRELFRIPFNPAAGAATQAYCLLDSVVHNSRMYWSVYDPGGAAPDLGGRVFGFDPDTGLLEQIGNAFGNAADECAGGTPICLCSYNGYLLAGTYGSAGIGPGRIWKIKPGEEETWTQVYVDATGYILSMAAYDGELYFGTQGGGGVNAFVRKFTNFLTGAVANSDTGATFVGGAYYAALVVFDGDLYATFRDSGGGGTELIRKFDGSAWSTDRDVVASDALRHVGQAFVYNSALYLPFVATAAANNDGFLLRKAAGGAWAKVANNINARGFFGRVDLVP
jgi:hypothetical protein